MIRKPRDEAAALQKLPQWVQWHISALDRDLEEARITIRAMTAEPVHARGYVTVRAHSIREEERGLARWEHVYFWVSDTDYIEVSHERFQGDRLGEYVRVRANSQLQIEPEVSNGVKVFARGWRKK